MIISDVLTRLSCNCLPSQLDDAQNTDERVGCVSIANFDDLN
jgi:hypothetical protein